MVTALDHGLETAATITDPAYADGYVSHFLFGGDISAPQERYDRLTAMLEEITAGSSPTATGGLWSGRPRW